MFRRSIAGLVSITSILSASVALLDFAVPIYLSVFLNQYEAIGNSKLLSFIMIFLVLCLFSWLIKMLLNHLFQRYAVHFKTMQHQRLFELMFGTEYTYLNNKEPTYLAERITMCVNTLYDVYAEGISKGFVAVVSIFVAFLIVVRQNSFVAFLLVVLLGVQVLGYKRLNQALQDRCVELQKKTANYFKNILSMTGQVDYIKQEGDHTGIMMMLQPFIRGIHKENAGVNRFAKDISTTLMSCIHLLQNLIYVYTAILTIQGSMSSSEFVLISMVSSLYMSGVRDLVNLNLGLRDMKGVREFIQELTAHQEPKGEQVLEHVEKIRFEIRQLGYGNTILIKEGVFEAKRGDLILLSGASGSGKTTLMKALLKFFPVNAILINEVDIREIRTSDLRERIQFFSQNIPIVAGTIEENLRMGKTIAPEIWAELTKKSFLQKFCSLPEGLRTKVLENGSNLSGGDKQKLALARLYLEQPEVIILDESTNSLDEETSYELLLEVKQIFSDNIVFLISHDSRLKALCNKMVWLTDKHLICHDISVS